MIKIKNPTEDVPRKTPRDVTNQKLSLVTEQGLMRADPDRDIFCKMWRSINKDKANT